MTDFEWAMITLGGLSLLVTLGTILVAVTRAGSRMDKKISGLKHDVSSAFETELRAAGVQQDEVFREVASGLRKFIEKVESEMHQIEIWGRDNYVQKLDFQKTTDRLFLQLDALANSIKDDFRELYRQLERNNSQKH